MADRKKELEIIRSSGVINPKMTMGEVLATSERLEALNPGALAAWTLISKDYVYKGDALQEEIEQVVTR